MVKTTEKKEIEKLIEKDEGVTLQHLGPVRQFIISKKDIIKIHRGCNVIAGSRLSDNVYVTPKSVVTFTKSRAEKLLKSGDFQRYGLGK